MKTKKCLYCESTFEGRINKKFCSTSCKNNFHNEEYRSTNSVVFNLDKILHKNRAVLKDMFSVYRSAPVALNVLKARGFDKNYHTHTFHAPSGEKYIMVYDLGYKLSVDDQVRIVHLESVA
ncbi:MAG: hypothetical protein R3277_11780 [Brumimicrobium sp.]|nr:hypothetical protein [Brumimicrobium sp.]